MSWFRADKAANNVVVVLRLHYINTLKQELDGTRAYLETDTDEVSVVNAHLNDLPVKFSVCVNEGQDKLWWFFLFYVLVFKIFCVLLAPYVCFHIFN